MFKDILIPKENIRRLKLAKTLNPKKLGAESLKIDRKLYIAGSDDPIDWAINLFYKSSTPYHDGFYYSAVNIINEHNLKEGDLDVIYAFSQGSGIAPFIGFKTKCPKLVCLSPVPFCKKEKKDLWSYCEDTLLGYRLAEDVIPVIANWLTSYEAPNKEMYTSDCKSLTFKHNLDYYSKVYSVG